MSSTSDTKRSVWNLDRYHVSYETGFMLGNPLEYLPPYFMSWNETAKNSPTLIMTKKMRDTVRQMPYLDHNQLKGHRQLRLAHLQLSLITSGYIWQEGDKGVPEVLPRCLAVPFYQISKRLGVQPVISHVSLALANWALIDANRPYVLENLRTLYNLPGGKSGEWFFTVTGMVEFSFAKGLKPLMRIVELLGTYYHQGGIDSVQQGQLEKEIISCLEEVTSVINMMQMTLSRMRDHLDSKTFFNVLRPYLAGWGGEGSPIPEGLVYEGISEAPITMPGGSAAQSSSLQVLDAILDVKHTSEKRSFLLHMRDFMPPDHKSFIEDLEQLPYSLKEFVTSSGSTALNSAYNKCLAALVSFRDYHIQIVKMYIIVPSSKANEGNYESLDKKGTGGTSIIPFLKDLCMDTQNTKVGNGSSELIGSAERERTPYFIYGIFITAAVIVMAGFTAKFVAQK